MRSFILFLVCFPGKTFRVIFIFYFFMCVLSCAVLMGVMGVDFSSQQLQEMLREQRKSEASEKADPFLTTDEGNACLIYHDQSVDLFDLLFLDPMDPWALPDEEKEEKKNQPDDNDNDDDLSFLRAMEERMNRQESVNDRQDQVLQEHKTDMKGEVFIYHLNVSRYT